jgi:hypothetical protein
MRQEGVRLVVDRRQRSVRLVRRNDDIRLGGDRWLGASIFVVRARTARTARAARRWISSE